MGKLYETRKSLKLFVGPVAKDLQTVAVRSQSVETQLF